MLKSPCPMAAVSFSRPGQSPAPLPSFFPLITSPWVLLSRRNLPSHPANPAAQAGLSSGVLTRPCSSRKEKVPFPVAGEKWASVRPCDYLGEPKGEGSLNRERTPRRTLPSSAVTGYAPPLGISSGFHSSVQLPFTTALSNCSRILGPGVL